MKQFRVYSLIAIIITAGTSALAGPASADTSTMALKNFRSILSSLVTVTGISPTSADIATYYQVVQAQLPRNGTLSEFNAQTYLADAGLGSVFCSHLIATDVATGVPITGPNAGIDFTKGPNTVTVVQTTQLVQNYISLFLQRSPTANEQTVLTAAFAAQTDSTNTVLETQNAVLAICSAVAGSFEFLSN